MLLFIQFSLAAVASNLLGLKILLSTLLSNTLSLHSTLNLRQPAAYRYTMQNNGSVNFA